MVFFKKSLIKSETEPTERVRVTKIDEQLKFGGGKGERSLVKTQINTQRGISHIRRFIWILSPDMGKRKILLSIYYGFRTPQHTQLEYNSVQFSRFVKYL